MEIYDKYLAFKLQLPPLISPLGRRCQSARFVTLQNSAQPQPGLSLAGVCSLQSATLHIYVSTYLHIYIILHMKIMEP